MVCVGLGMCMVLCCCGLAVFDCVWLRLVVCGCVWLWLVALACVIVLVVVDC